MEKSKLIPIVTKDLIISKFDEENYYTHQTIFDYRLKISNKSYELLQLADGKNNLEDIKNAINDCDINIEFLEDFYFQNFAKYGIIENQDIVVEQIGKPDYLKLSFILFPAKIVNLITPFLKFLFVSKTMYFVLFFSLFFLTFTTFKYYHIFLNYNLYQVNWLYFGLLGFISVTFHEFGHASSANYFGAKHGGIGGGFYLFSPVYFADVSDIWKLSRYKRIIVNLSGVYFESLISCLYISLGFFTTNEMFIVIGVFTFFHSLWNLNPFLRNDGYWVLSDAINYPNLTKNSLILLKDFVFSIFKKTNFQYSPKNILLVIYSLINQSFIFIFLYYSIKNYGLSLLTFPFDFFIYIKDIICAKTIFNLRAILNYFIPFLFYYILINYSKSLVLNLLKSKKSIPK